MYVLMSRSLNPLQMPKGAPWCAEAPGESLCGTLQESCSAEGGVHPRAGVWLCLCTLEGVCGTIIFSPNPEQWVVTDVRPKSIGRKVIVYKSMTMTGSLKKEVCIVLRRKHSEEGCYLVPGYQSDWELHRQIRQKLNLFRQIRCNSQIKEISFNVVQGILSHPQKVYKIESKTKKLPAKITNAVLFNKKSILQ